VQELKVVNCDFLTASGRRVIKCVFALFVVQSNVYAQTSTLWPEVPAPPRATVESVAADLTYNGVPMRVQHFNSKVSAQEILAYYRGHWGRGELKPVENKVNGWQTIGMPAGPFYMTVQVKDSKSGGSEGMIGVSSTSSLMEVPKVENFAKLGGTQVVSVVESRDIGRSNKQIVLSNGHSVAANARFYDSELAFSGWKKLQDNTSARGSVNEQGYLAMYQKGKEQIDIAINRSPNGVTTAILANLIRYE
jgi:hypothetical protein